MASSLIFAWLLIGLFEGTPTTRRYCIVGAGPAGVQLGHFLKHAQRDYVIYDRARSAGSFFQKYPRHRTLISLNKRVVREGRSAEFAMRHDWNSLLDSRDLSNRTKPVTQRSKALFPHADVLAEYIDAFAEEQADAIQYGVEVRHIRRVGTSGSSSSSVGQSSGKLFELTLARRGSKEQETSLCQEVVIATGFFVPRGAEMAVDGAHLTRGYEGLPEAGDEFEGQSVVVLGMGNAALETAQTLQPYTSELHLLGRRRELPEGGKGVRFAHQTHYVGDIRAGRTTILDTYLLKSLDTFTPEYLENGLRLVLLACRGGRLCVFQGMKERCADKQCRDGHDKGAQGLSYRHLVLLWPKGGRLGARVQQILAQHVAADLAAGPDGPAWAIREQKLGQLDPRVGSPEEKKAGIKERKAHGISDKTFDRTFEVLYVTTNLLRTHPKLLDELQLLRTNHSGDDFRYPIDHVVHCFGWKLDTSIFDKSTPIATTHRGKFPELTSGYEAKKVPGLYFAGTLTHGLDFRKSAGGFVHGFRYTARALFRLLEEKNFQVPWPLLTEPLQLSRSSHASVVENVALAMHRRINEAAGPYQMFQALGDMVVIEQDNSSAKASYLVRYLEEVPLDLFHDRFQNAHRLTWVYRYGDKFYGRAVLDQGRATARDPMQAYNTQFLHPYLAFYRKGQKKPEMQHWMLDDVYTQWNEAPVYSPLVRFVARALAGASNLKDWWKDFKTGEPGNIDEEWWTEDMTDLHETPSSSGKCTV